MPKSKPNRKRGRKFIKRSGSKANGSHRRNQEESDGAAASIIARVNARQCPEWSKFKRMNSTARDFSNEVNGS